jgi:hypothetical protein
MTNAGRSSWPIPTVSERSWREMWRWNRVGASRRACFRVGGAKISPRPSPAAQPDPVAIGRNQGCNEHWEGNAYENFSRGEQR